MATKVLNATTSFEIATDFGTTDLCLVMLYLEGKFVIFQSGEVPSLANAEPFCERLIEPAVLDAWNDALANSHLQGQENWFKKYYMFSLLPWNIILDPSVLEGTFGTPVWITQLAERLVFSQPYPITSSGAAHVIPDYRRRSWSDGPGIHIHKTYLLGTSDSTSYVVLENAARDPDSWDHSVVYFSQSGAYNATKEQVSLGTAAGPVYLPTTKTSYLEGKALPWTGAKLGTDKGFNKRLADWILGYRTKHNAYPFVFERSPRAGEGKHPKGALDATAVALMDTEPSCRVACLRRQSFVAGAMLAFTADVFEKKYQRVVPREMIIDTFDYQPARNVSAVSKAASDVVSQAKEDVENNVTPLIAVSCRINNNKGGYPAMGFSLPVDISSSDRFYNGDFVHVEGKDHFYDLRLAKHAGGQGDRPWSQSSYETEDGHTYANNPVACCQVNSHLDHAVMCTPDFIYGYDISKQSARNLSGHFYCRFTPLPYLMRVRDPHTSKLLPPMKRWIKLAGVNFVDLKNAGYPKSDVNNRDVGKKIFSIQEVYL